MDEYYDALARQSKPNQKVRDEMATIQEQRYQSQGIKDLESSKAEVYKWICEWEKSSTKYLGEEPISVDMQKFLALSQCEMNRFIDDVHGQIENCIGKKETIPYLWVSFRNDGMVVTVGRTSASLTQNNTYNRRDDLFQLLKLPTGTENFLLKSKFDKDLFDNYNRYLATCLGWAWIVPVNLDKVTDDEKISHLETLLGDYLIDQQVPILNFYSHRA